MAKQWIVIQSRPASEAKAAASLAQIGVEVFFPQETVWRKTLKGRHEHDRPLIAGYLFAHMDPDDLWRLNGMDGVSGPLRGLSDYVGLVLFVDWLKVEVEAGAFDKTLAEKARRGAFSDKDKGAEVRVLSGPYQGRMATFMRMESKGRARVMFSIFDQSNEAVIHEGKLERAA